MTRHKPPVLSGHKLYKIDRTTQARMERAGMKKRKFTATVKNAETRKQTTIIFDHDGRPAPPYKITIDPEMDFEEIQEQAGGDDPQYAARFDMRGDRIHAWLTRHDKKERRNTIAESVALSAFVAEANNNKDLTLNDIINALIDINELIEPLVKKELERPIYKGKALEDLDPKDRAEAEANILEAYCQASNRLYDKEKLKLLKTRLDLFEGSTPAEAIADVIRANVTDIEALEQPLDKINSNIWRLFEETPTGQYQFKIDVGASGEIEPIDTLFSLTFGDDMNISKNLTPFDKRVFCAAASLYNAENAIISDTLIYKNMGYTGKPAPNQLEKIHDSVTKLMQAQFSIDNAAEAKKYNYDRVIFEGPVLPVIRKTAILNGKPVKSAIAFTSQPMLMEFSRRRRQITTIPLAVFQNKEVSITAANIAIEDYLIERIARLKNGNGQPKILYNTIFENANINGVKQQARKKDTIKKYLDHYKDVGFIDGYKLEANGVTIRVSPAPGSADKKK